MGLNTRLRGGSFLKQHRRNACATLHTPAQHTGAPLLEIDGRKIRQLVRATANSLTSDNAVYGLSVSGWQHTRSDGQSHSQLGKG